MGTVQALAERTMRRCGPASHSDKFNLCTRTSFPGNHSCYSRRNFGGQLAWRSTWTKLSILQQLIRNRGPAVLSPARLEVANKRLLSDQSIIPKPLRPLQPFLLFVPSASLLRTFLSFQALHMLFCLRLVRVPRSSQVLRRSTNWLQRDAVQLGLARHVHEPQYSYVPRLESLHAASDYS